MASSSSSSSISSIQKTFKYDVFLSFRGEDTRKNFVDHLYTALQSQGIDTFKDDDRIKQGKRIDNQLISSIQDSKFFIIVFSKNYASSSWCLDELVKIMECHKTMQHTAYPVFYKVEPFEVRKQHGKFGKAFSKHKNEKYFGKWRKAFSKHKNGESVGKWRKALEEAANLAGWELKNFANGHEAKLIQKIVEEISLELRSINSGVDGKLVGMESRMKQVLSIVETGSHEVRMIGIKGMGGAGKTTLARAIFDNIRYRFDGSSFVENVREKSKNYLQGLNSLQQQVLSDVLRDKGISVNSVYDGKNMMRSRLCGRRVVVVLDDVDHIDQLEALAGAPNWFKLGSIIIITTRDEQVLVGHRVKRICDVNLLSDDEAICLFSRYSFGREIPIQGYEELSAKVIRYAGGLPLTIKVLGSFLCGKDKLEWEDALERLKTIPLEETLKKLELSYIDLEMDYKEIFLDVACLLKGWEKDRAIMLLESCGFHARNGLRVLEQKSLITINNYDVVDIHGYLNKYDVLGMHDHIEEMAMNIVRREHPNDPGKHTRLWNQLEIKDVLANNLGIEAIRCIKMSYNDDEMVMEGLGNMNKLRCLIVETYFDVDALYFPSELQYLSWEKYPHQSLPKNLGANNLVGLEMRFNKINQLWEMGERKVLNKLKFMDLSDSYRLRTLDLGLTPNLEKLVLERCYDFVALQMPYPCLNLKSLLVSESMLETLDLTLTPNLENLHLEYCCDLVELHMPVESAMLRSLKLTYSKLRTLDLGLTPNLEKLYLKSCNDLAKLYIPSPCLNLTSLELDDLEKLKTLDLGLTPNLANLSLRNCYVLVELHIPSPCLNLTSIELSSIKLTNLDLGPALNLEKLHLSNYGGVRDLHGGVLELHMPVESLKLRYLKLRGIKLRTLDLGLTPNLEKLHLEYCYGLVQLQMPLESLKLKSLKFAYLKLRTLDLRLTVNLEELYLHSCYDLVELYMPVECLRLTSLEFTCLEKLRTLDLGLTPNLEYLDLIDCSNLVELQMAVEYLKLRTLKFTYLKLRTLDLGLTPNLEDLKLSNCDDLVQLHMHDVCPSLESVDLSHSKLKTFDLGLTPNLKKLLVKECDDLVQIHMPVPLKGCTTLTSIYLKKNFLFKGLQSLVVM